MPGRNPRPPGGEGYSRGDRLRGKLRISDLSNIGIGPLWIEIHMTGGDEGERVARAAHITMSGIRIVSHVPPNLGIIRERVTRGVE